MPRLVDADEFEKRCMFSKEVYKKVDDDGLYAVLEELRMTPTIDAEPVRHGHWIKANDPMSSPFDTMKRCLCSECREWGAVTSYCPHCGVRMDEEEDGQRDVD